MKIDKRKTYYAIIDTETANSLDFPLVYDLGVLICDKQGNTVCEKNWFIREILTNKKMMNTAYYRTKLPLYRKMYKADKSLLVPFDQAREELNQIMADYNVKVLTAYNLQFDTRALKSTMIYLHRDTKSGWDICPFFNNSYDFVDLWSFACETILKSAVYNWYVETYDWKSPKGNKRSNAECAYRYITGNKDFVEDHTALSDCRIEKVILIKCLRQHKKYTKNEFVDNPWRLLQATG